MWIKVQTRKRSGMMRLLVVQLRMADVQMEGAKSVGADVWISNWRVANRRMTNL